MTRSKTLPLVALASGTLGLGIAEFVMMGILPAVSSSLSINIAQAGHCISAYALGVCIGAPLTALIASDRPLRRVLVALMVIFVVGHTMAGLARSYHALMIARVVSGLPHGAFFGVGSIVVERLSDRNKATQSMAIMIAGMTVANVVGVPLGTWLSTAVSWRLIFFLTAAWGLLTLIAIALFVPHEEPLPEVGLRGQFRFARHASALYIIVATMFANGGIFCWYSYVLPQMYAEAHMSPDYRTWLMTLAGIGMVVGNLLGGYLTSRFPAARTGMKLQICAVFMLVLMSLSMSSLWLSATLTFVLTGLLFSFSPAQQMLILEHAHGAKMMAAAFIQIAFNFGNAVGAYLGGLPIDAGLGYRYSPLIGAAMVSLGALSMFLFVRHRSALARQ